MQEEIKQTLEESDLVEEVVEVVEYHLGAPTCEATYRPDDYEQDETPQVDGFVPGTLFRAEDIDEVPDGTHTVVFSPQ